ncbi:MAG: RecBCD enzyme subunit RecC [Betaproteobacteria bacterium ADurb.Bin341]|nr:MAG: RecBCD enzyme subunit RecC [Betaproteobacteria bacterium ADurb.Bin341]
MLRLSCSNRFEILQDQLLDRLACGRDPVFSPWQIIVPSAAIRRRVELACADRFGIAANLESPYLAQWLWQQIGRVVAVPEISPFSPASLSWRIFELLGDAVFVEAQPRLHHYLKQADEVMRLDLAVRVAQLLEHYITYRPHWLAVWSAGTSVGLPGGAEDEAWQAALWRRIADELGIRRQHPAALFFETIEKLGEQAACRAGLPDCAHIFCLPAMPPLYLEILRRLSRWMKIDLYVLNPCREYWFEIVDRKRLSYLATRQQDLFHEVGNSLLASWGRQTQAHIDLLFADAGQIVEENSHFQPSTDKSLLAALHNALLDLEELTPGSVPLAEGDRSIEIHVCHSLTRELEVLQDQLLGLFVEDEGLKPGDILVLTPDLEAAAPLIDAVFGTVPEARRIPYQITGRAQTCTNPVAAVLDRLLGLCDSRFTASSIFDLLQQAPVAARFGLATDDLERIHGWMNEAGIRWGLDADQRQTLGLPAEERHTLADGLNRLFLAFALGDGEEARDTVIAGSIGAGHPQGSTAAALGTFWSFVRLLETAQREWRCRRDADGWQTLLNDWLERFIPLGTEWLDDLNVVRAAIAELHRNMAQGGLRAPVSGEIIRAALTAVLDDPARGAVPGGLLTFSALAGLRGLPYRVICLIGMNDGVFPGNARPAEFDLMARFPQRGDRQRRLDERNLFLDLLLAARQRFYLSYSGRSIRDDSRCPPSVLLAELLDYLTAATAADPADPQSLQAARRRLVVEHPLQPFSACYFDPEGDPRRRSFSQEYQQNRGQTTAFPEKPWFVPDFSADFFEEEADGSALDCLDQRPFFTEPLPPPGEVWRSVRLESLIGFFRHPGKALLQRIGIRLPESPDELQDEEPFLPDWRGRQRLAGRLLPWLLQENRGQTTVFREKPWPVPDFTDFAKAGNEFPPGILGERWLVREIEACRKFSAALAPLLVEACLPPVEAVLDFDIEGERWQLYGTLAEVRPQGLLRYRYDELRATDYLSGWIEHLSLCAVAPPDVIFETRWHGRDGSFCLKPMGAAEARQQLEGLLRHYRAGLMAPLSFFPKSAWAYMSGDLNLGKARQIWVDTSGRGWGEGDDAVWRLVLRGVTDPLDRRFEETAQAILAPLIAQLDA